LLFEVAPSLLPVHTSRHWHTGMYPVDRSSLLLDWKQFV